LFPIEIESESAMLDDATKAQLKSYLERATQPIEIVASLDDSQNSGEMLSLLKDVAEASPLVKLTESRDDSTASLLFPSTAPAKTTARVLPACPWAMNSPR
jgi:alkyl hydroperoxide reductase subunit F